MNRHVTWTGSVAALPLAALKKIDDVCARFEAVWAAGGAPSIEGCLALVPEPARGQLFGELVRTELELRAKRGERPSAASLRGRFPQYAGIIDRVMGELAGDKRPAAPPRQTVSYRGTNGPPDSGETGPPVTPTRPPDAAPGYEILSELGRGGMGVVYLARHLRLQRLVALKVILAGDLSTPGQQERFRAEALAVARLKHPNLVQIYAGGRHNDRPFLALEYVEGGSLEQRLAGRPQPPRSAAAFLETVARAVHAVHNKGIIHRDLKPANILLDEADSATRPLENCTPKISDFGLARNIAEGEQDPALATQSGVIVGTPSYMAPEQALARPVGPATDVYALGVILYEMLTGRPPFQGASVLDTLDLIRRQEPVPPRQLQVKCPRDLETICLKCLEKDPARRYASALDLADDCAAFRENRPLRARPVGAMGKASRWVRRNPAVAGLLAAVVLALLTGTAVASFFALRARQWAVAAEVRAGEVQLQWDRADQHAAAEYRARRQAEQLAGAEAEARRRAEWLAYANQVCLAQREFERKMAPKATMILDMCRPDFRHWEHAYLRGARPEGPSAVTVHSGAVTALAFHPEGRWVAAAGEKDTVKLWDARSGEPGASFAGPDGPILALAFSADGRCLAAAAGSGAVILWDVADGRQVHALQTSAGPIHGAAFSPDGRLVALADDATGLTVWDVVEGRSVRSLAGARQTVSRMAFSPDSRHLAAASGDGGVVVWDLTTGRRKDAVRGGGDAVHGLAFSPDGGRLAVARGKQLAVWDLGREEPLFACGEHAGPLSCLTYSGDGQRLFTGSADQTVKVWEASRGQCLLTLEGHATPVSSLALSPDGRSLVTADRAGLARVWQASAGQTTPGAR